MKDYIFKIGLLFLFTCIGCKGDISQKSPIDFSENKNQILESISSDCYTYLTELIKSSNFPFELYNVSNKEILLVIDEENRESVNAKIIIETDGTGTIGWIEFRKKEKELFNTSANLEVPEKLKYDIKWLSKYEDCINKNTLAEKQIPLASIKNCIQKPNIELPYSQNHKGMDNQLVLECNIKNSEDWICDSDKLKYTPLLKFDDINIILIPQDCGDFSYRYYLLAIKNGEIVSDLYVEGEWYEPGGEENIETTSFKIQKDHTINVLTKNRGGETGIDINQNYKITPNGIIEKF